MVNLVVGEMVQRMVGSINVTSVIYFSVLGAIIIAVLIIAYNKKEIKHDLKKIDKMKGLEFEHYVAETLTSKGYYKVSVTKGSGDYGVDVICFHRSRKYVFQVKRYTKSVGVGAIQEIVAGKAFYKAHKAVAITNSFFTPAAVNMAKKCDVLLIDRNDFQNNTIKL